ncbi:MAG TPA: superoxide dismutase family protein [Allosphingosinicella sp.]|jgi:Cu-Zn family superoxide dismutase
MKKAFLASLGLGVTAALGACAGHPAADPATPGARARAELVDASGRVLARSLITQETGGLTVWVEAEDLAPGSYGAHVHAVGRCDPPGFESAGPHWNPTERQHGSQNPHGQHLGDLPNLLVGTDGQGSLQFTIPGAVLSGGGRALIDGDGAALVIHAGPDDYRSDPSGNSGARIGCGVIG